MSDDTPDLSEKWAIRLERVRRVMQRTDVTGMTRPPRDPDERAFLRRTGQLGPYVEVTSSASTDSTSDATHREK